MWVKETHFYNVGGIVKFSLYECKALLGNKTKLQKIVSKKEKQV